MPTDHLVDGGLHRQDARLARTLVEEAGRCLVRLRATGMHGRLLRQRGDETSHRLIMERLSDQRPDDCVLSEEGVDDPARLASDRVWIVDPLDGTREYGEGGRTDWAVHVALWERGSLVAGAVALPARKSIFGSDQPIRRRRRGSGGVRLAVSRSRPPGFVTALARQMQAELVPMGSAGVKAMAVLTGEADAYVHAGGQYEWDSAAPVAVCLAAGLHASRVDGSPLTYNQPDPLLPDVLICRPDMSRDVLDSIHDVMQEALPR